MRAVAASSFVHRAATPPTEWRAIREASCPLVIEPRELGKLADDARALARDAPFERLAAGRIDRALTALGDVPGALLQDVARLTHRFAALMAAEAIRIRLEGVATNACRKIHADYTDVRLITTYAGPGTDYVPHGARPEEASLRRVPTGWVALFKGRSFHPDHGCCLHRSPPAGDMGVGRLVLVIDTPLAPQIAPL